MKRAFVFLFFASILLAVISLLHSSINPWMLSGTDKIRISNIYDLQSYMYLGEKNTQYPSSVQEFTKKIEGTTLKLVDPKGNLYRYTPGKDGRSYTLSIELDNGSTYVATSTTFEKKMAEMNTDARSRDMYRKVDLIGISSGLHGFYMEKGFYPEKLVDLLPAKWGMGAGTNGEQHIPNDIQTNKEFMYKVSADKQSFYLSGQLEYGIEYVVTN